MAFLRVFEGILGKKMGFLGYFGYFFEVLYVLFIAQMLFRAAKEVRYRELGVF
jgi:hypothetical protein